MHADIAGPDRSEQRVGQRVQPDIGVRMTGERLLVRDVDAADHDMVAGREAVHVEALPDADIAEPRGEQPLGRREVSRGRHLQIVLAAGDDDRRDAGGLGDRGVVGQHAARGGPMRLEYRPEVKSLRRLRPPQSRAVDGFANRRRPRRA